MSHTRVCVSNTREFMSESEYNTCEKRGQNEGKTALTGVMCPTDERQTNVRRTSNERQRACRCSKVRWQSGNAYDCKSDFGEFNSHPDLWEHRSDSLFETKTHSLPRIKNDATTTITIDGDHQSPQGQDLENPHGTDVVEDSSNGGDDCLEVWRVREDPKITTVREESGRTSEEEIKRCG